MDVYFHPSLQQAQKMYKDPPLFFLFVSGGKLLPVDFSGRSLSGWGWGGALGS